MLTGSTHPRQATDWLAEIDQAKSIQYLDDVGSAFGSIRLSFEYLDSKIAKCYMKKCESSIQQKSVGGRRIAKEEKSRKVDRKTDRFHDLRLLQDPQCSREIHKRALAGRGVSRRAEHLVD